jgi:hypothetical protein
MTLSAWASEWLLANSKWVIFQLFLYHDNMRQETCLKNEVLKFQEYDDLYKLFWMNFVADLLRLFRSFYLLYAALPSGVS